jgi:hypothetical protein
MSTNAGAGPERRTQVCQLGAAAVPMPLRPDLERALLPTSKAISAAAEALVAEG